MAWVKWIAAFCAVSVLWLIPASAQAPKRVALVIANSTYGTYAPLPNTEVDAAMVTETFRKAGFTVGTVKANLGQAAFNAALAEFQNAAANADIAAIYYAGHGIEVGGRNWLIPTDVTLTDDSQLPFQAIDVDMLMKATAGARARLIVLDACRENPFAARMRRVVRTAGTTRDISSGLSAPSGDGARGTYLMYSAAAGELAADGVPGEGSPFARAFARHMIEPGLELRIAAGKVADTVFETSGQRQLPFTNSSLGGEQIIFVAGTAAQPTAGASRTPPPVAAARQKAAGERFTECGGCPEMIVVPGGAFTMGSPDGVGGADEHPQTLLNVPLFSLSRTEVTVAQWEVCMSEGACRAPSGVLNSTTTPRGAANTPIRGVTYGDALAYVSWINNRLGTNRYRLPSEAEWEYAARANSTGSYPWGGASISEYANAAGRTGKDKFDGAAPVGSFPPNAFGLLDMHGNVSEWVRDCYWPNPARRSARALEVATGAFCQNYVIRGGSFLQAPPALRSAARAYQGVATISSQPTTGFRIARSEP